MARERLTFGEHFKLFEGLFKAAREFQRENSQDNIDLLTLAAYRVALAKGSMAELERDEKRLSRTLDAGPRMV